ncbi:MAG TPA: GatB/YqeY domain-containing protein [Tepidisphaeraceae bacterium]|nr:GatB/YqeY domain-containing protein [Tepidisphaeraceae bacterium]
MELLNRLTEDMKAAMKSGQKDRLGVIRMLLSDVRNIDLMPNKPTAEQAVEAYAKKLRKSIEEYERIGRPDEAATLKAELVVVEEYLPEKASAEDTERLVEEFLASNSFTEKQVGQAMGAFIKAHGAQVDKARANELIRRKLAGK